MRHAARLACVLAWALAGAACGGVQVEPVSASATAPEKPAAPTTIAPAPSAAPPPATPWSPVDAPDPEKAMRWTLAAIACFTAGAWDEARDEAGSTPSRCRVLATEALGAKASDDQALAAVRSLDAVAVTRVVDAVERAAPDDPHLAALIRATAEAAREAIAARRACEVLRKDLAAKNAAKHDEHLQGSAAVLGAKEALATLSALDAGPHAALARTTTLVIAADHLESARGLAPRAKVLVAAPAFEVALAVPRPAKFEPGAWLSYVTAAAKAAGHPVKAKGSTHEREQAAFAGVAAGFADRFAALAEMATTPEVRAVAAGYATRLRAVVDEAGKKAQAKADAGTTADDAEAKKPKKKAKP